MENNSVPSSSPPPPVPQPVASPSPISTPPIVSDPTSSMSAAPPPPSMPEKRSGSKLWVILVVIMLFIGLLGVGGFFIFSQMSKPATTPKGINSDTVVPDSNTPPPPNFPSETLAPPGATEYKKKNYRSKKISPADARTLCEKVCANLGYLQLPTDIKFVHEEEYKGVPIKWTSGQPIPEAKLAWIKKAIDKLPPYYYQDHPAKVIVSATYQDLGGTGYDPNSLGAVAYASGLNIFITKSLTSPLEFYQDWQEEDVLKTIYHEWTHVIQNYEILQTFSEDYLSIRGNGIIVSGSSPFTKDFAKSAGWVFQYDEHGDSSFAKLGDDAQSQKTTDYGKTGYGEDMAESAAGFISCKKDDFSQARMDWWEKTIGQSADSFCH